MSDVWAFAMTGVVSCLARLMIASCKLMNFTGDYDWAISVSGIDKGHSSFECCGQQRRETPKAQRSNPRRGLGIVAAMLVR
jgi:hypothetical protein